MSFVAVREREVGDDMYTSHVVVREGCVEGDVRVTCCMWVSEIEMEREGVVVKDMNEAYVIFALW